MFVAPACRRDRTFPTAYCLHFSSNPVWAAPPPPPPPLSPPPPRCHCCYCCYCCHCRHLLLLPLPFREGGRGVTKSPKRSGAGGPLISLRGPANIPLTRPPYN